MPRTWTFTNYSKHPILGEYEENDSYARKKILIKLAYLQENENNFSKDERKNLAENDAKCTFSK